MMERASKFFLNMVVEPQVRKFCGPLFFSASNTTPKGTIKGSASFGLVDTGQKKLLVTCWHVIYGKGGFKQIHAEDSTCRFAIGIGGTQSSFHANVVNLRLDETDYGGISGTPPHAQRPLIWQRA